MRGHASPGLFLLDAVPAVERETTVPPPLGSGRGRRPRPGCENPRNLLLTSLCFLTGVLVVARGRAGGLVWFVVTIVCSSVQVEFLDRDEDSP